MSNNGKLGEKLFAERMSANGYKVQDVSNDPSFWSKDVDFVIESPYTGEVKSFECKWDTRIENTKNLYLELENIHSKNGIGWFEFIEADYLAYGNAASRTFYVIPLLELKERVKQLPQRIARCGSDSIGLLVSLRDIADITQIL